MSIKGVNKAKITNFFRVLGVSVTNLDDDYMLIDGIYRIHKGNLWWSNLQTMEKGQGYSVLLDRYKKG
ncbi:MULTISPECIES: hypothetical protein [Bacillus cereus group]|uniref:Uncharacterized protein n=1 Tax=Bacillus thuringiensis TaxID=1428 RepID=A0A9X6WLY3_BACTU|nr:hypothetical protein [Bacillus thuringiensis]OOZ83516.1 hypothetical protein BHL35_00545 [Bacillus cereus]PFJ38557.1 hypothetical protein COJ15_17890 [Bacillus thuringiensis]PFN46480.1 hypothetical protein COJ75_31445 [Bacillus thuringiensis]